MQSGTNSSSVNTAARGRVATAGYGSGARSRGGKRGFRPVLVVSVIVAASVLISRWAVWYGNEVSIPRYCPQPEQVVESLRSVMAATAAADGESRRAAMVAAKLLFLMPRESGESERAYLARVRVQLELRCR